MSFCNVIMYLCIVQVDVVQMHMWWLLPDYAAQEGQVEERRVQK